ncbi:hypothetical protein K1T71_000041 [Dendrolimus kikuchii]|uniref:Uncharacterized protein n=1 Tax=Dendrolimus kikuchii TaxID=765133 RepID=A0ACC1DI28_9NEOP|nr:hypothetical protein K1T71_000041 [Dendrolimus kikuchii]
MTEMKKANCCAKPNCVTSGKPANDGNGTPNLSAESSLQKMCEELTAVKYNIIHVMVVSSAFVFAIEQAARSKRVHYNINLKQYTEKFDGYTGEILTGAIMSRHLTKRYLTPEDDYNCPFSDDTQAIAENELRETENSRSQALSALRSWIEQNPRFKAIRMDSNYLLRFLRAKKFSVPMAQIALERYVLLRQSWGIAFNQLDFKLPVMMELLELGFVFMSPFKDKLGRRVAIHRPGVFDPYKYTNQDMCRAMGICFETVMEDEDAQVRGIVHFADGAGVTFPHLTLFTPKEAVRIVKNGERTVPIRHKEIYGVNVHPTVKFALDFGMGLISEKIRRRVRLYTSIKDVEIDKKLLPQEYGGVMPMREMIELWKQELAKKRDILLLNDKMAVRLEMYSEAAREGAISALRAGLNTCSGADAVGDAMRGLTGNFRKLEVD